MDENEAIEFARAADVDRKGKILGSGDAVEHQAEGAVGPVLQQHDDRARAEAVVKRRPSDQEGSRQGRHGAPRKGDLAVLYAIEVPAKQVLTKMPYAKSAIPNPKSRTLMTADE